jgi:hypothetical protein
MQADGRDQTMNKTIATASAGALLCVLALAGCRAGGGSASGAGNGSAAGTSATQTGPVGVPGDGVPSATPTGAAAVDSELGSVDQQLGTAGGDLAQATQSPADGG